LACVVFVKRKYEGSNFSKASKEIREFENYPGREGWAANSGGRFLRSNDSRRLKGAASRENPVEKPSGEMRSERTGAVQSKKNAKGCVQETETGQRKTGTGQLEARKRQKLLLPHSPRK